MARRTIEAVWGPIRVTLLAQIVNVALKIDIAYRWPLRRLIWPRTWRLRTDILEFGRGWLLRRPRMKVRP